MAFKGLLALFNLGILLAIHMGMNAINAYELLEVSEQATADEIRSAFHRKAKLHHPDLGGKVEDFLDLKKAYEILMDFRRRECVGKTKLFRKPLMRIHPSQTNPLKQLLQNLDLLRKRIEI